MIRVTVDLVPFGIEEHKKKIGSLVLANVGNLGLGICEYEAIASIVFSNGEEEVVKKMKCQHSRQDGIWKLLEILLRDESVSNDDEILRLKEALTG